MKILVNNSENLKNIILRDILIICINYHAVIEKSEGRIHEKLLQQTLLKLRSKLAIEPAPLDYISKVIENDGIETTTEIEVALKFWLRRR